MRRGSKMAVVALVALAGVAACEADAPEALQEGPGSDAVEDAPLTDAVPPTTLDNPGVIAQDTLQELNVEPAAPVDTAL